MQSLEEYIEKLNSEFKEMINGEFAKLDTGEFFTRTEVSKYIQRRLEIYNADMLNENIKKSRQLLGIVPEQRLVNNRSKAPKKSKNNSKDIYDGGNFNIVYRDKIEELINMNLSKNEKLVFFIIRDFIVYPYNCVMINNEIPRFTDLEPIISLTERTIRDALKLLEEKNIIKLIQSGHRKAIYVNPQYYASGKELNIDTLRLFDLVECDNEKVNSYLD